MVARSCNFRPQKVGYVFEIVFYSISHTYLATFNMLRGSELHIREENVELSCLITQHQGRTKLKLTVIAYKIQILQIHGY